VRFVEVSHRIEPGMTTYPGLPQPVEEVFLDYDDSRERYGGQAEFRMASLRISGNTGTYVDAPIHRHRGATDLAGLPLDRLAHVPVTVIDAFEPRAIGPEAFAGAAIAGRAVLVRTGFSKHFGTEAYAHENPYLTAGAADLLAAAGPALVGIDSLNIDDTSDASRPAHTTLLAAGIPICEHMTNLDQVPKEGGLLHAVPIAWVGGTSFPVRAYVMVPDAGDATR
jgi:kynurenine formamidase